MFSWTRSNVHSYFALLFSFFLFLYEKMARSPWNEAVFSRGGGVFQDNVLTWHSLTNSRLLVFWSVTLTPCFFKSYCLLLLKYMMAFCQFLYLWVRIVSFSPYFHLNLSICGNFEPAIKRDAFYIIFCIHPQNSNAV